jgi:hypothetical protein
MKKRHVKATLAGLLALAVVPFGADIASAGTGNCGSRLCYWAGEGYPGSPNWAYTSTGNSSVNYRSRYNGYSDRSVNRYTGLNQTGTGTCMPRNAGNTFTSLIYVGSHLIPSSGTINC